MGLDDLSYKLVCLVQGKTHLCECCYVISPLEVNMLNPEKILTSAEGLTDEAAEERLDFAGKTPSRLALVSSQ